MARSRYALGGYPEGPWSFEDLRLVYGEEEATRMWHERNRITAERAATNAARAKRLAARKPIPTKTAAEVRPGDEIRRYGMTGDWASVDTVERTESGGVVVTFRGFARGVLRATGDQAVAWRER